MANKFRSVEPVEPGVVPTKPVQMGMNAGYRGDVSPREIPPDASPNLVDVRFERRAVRKDFGWTPIGTAATARVLLLLEHKYIDAQSTFHRIIRIWRNGLNQAELEVWDGVNWVSVDTSVETINAVYLSAVSALGCAYCADGNVVLEWCEELEKFPQEDDFPNNNEMTTEGAEEFATIDPGDALPLDYTIHYDVYVFSSPTQDTRIKLAFIHEGVKVGEAEHIIDQLSTFPVSLLDRSFTFTRAIALNDQVSIKVEEAEGGGTTEELDFLTDGPSAGIDFTGAKTPATQPALANSYTFIYDIDSIVGSATVGCYIDNGAGFLLVGQETHSVDEFGAEITVTVAGVIDPGARFGLNLDAGVGNLLEQGVRWVRSNADFQVHGHNKALQGDDPAGVTYETTGAVVSVFQAINPGPGGRFLAFFARRLVVLRNFGDTQALTWSADGILNDFIGAGSGEIILVESHSDAIDDLMGTAVLNSNFMALFRKRSIWRVFETGAVTPALGAVSWIENLGTNAPFSIRHVLGGAMFLGHDQMVYFLTEQGPQPVGKPIQQYLIERLTSNLDLVDSSWDPTFGEYLLGIPLDGATEIDEVWAFDVDRFLQEQELIWRPRPMAVQRFAVASEVE